MFFTPENGGEKRSLGEKEFAQKTTTAGYTYQMYEGEGKSSKEHENLYMTWMVPYEAGTITAKAWDKDGQEITENIQGRTSVTTTGAAAKLQVKADRETIKANGEDLSCLTVNVTDENGNIVPNAENKEGKFSFSIRRTALSAGSSGCRKHLL